VLLLLVTVGLYFSGTVLKWDQEAYEAMLHQLEGARFLGALGFLLSEFTQSVPMLVRLYIAHVSILPALLTLLVVGHFFLVKHHGISLSPWDVPGVQSAVETFARHLRLVGAYSLLLLGALMVLAVLLLPPSLGPAPVEGIEVTKPPWLFLPLYTLENLVGLTGLLYAPLALFLLLVLVPLLDRKGPLHPGARRRVLAAGVALVLLAMASGIWAWWSTPMAHVGM
jgi:ubiquinol-cytochrome c reductase cytochrome b subunit